jgi:hypothetical protein
LVSSSGFQHRNRLVKNILRLFVTNSRGKPRTRPFPPLSRPISRVLHRRSLHLLIAPPSNVSYSHLVRGAADAPYSLTVHSPHTGPALGRLLPSLPAPPTSLLTRCGKPPGGGGEQGPWQSCGPGRAAAMSTVRARQRSRNCDMVKCVETALIFHAWYECVTRSGGLCATEAARI